MLVRLLAVLIVSSTLISVAAEAGPVRSKRPRFKPHGPPVKLDITARRCIERGGADYLDSLFYEEFKSLAACRAALRRS